MSWATCFSGSNNIHFNFPPIMQDGRNYASYQPEALTNNKIQMQNNINSNWKYLLLLFVMIGAEVLERSTIIRKGW